MGNLKKSGILSVIAAIVGVIMLICVKIIVPVCTGMVEMASGTQTFMKCHYTAVAVSFFAIILVVNAVAALVTKQAMAPGIVAIVVCIFVYLVFNDSMGIGICAKSEMACHMTAPVIKLCAAIEFLLGAGMVVMGAKEANKGK